MRAAELLETRRALSFLLDSSVQLEGAEKAACLGPEITQVYREARLQEVVIAGKNPGIDVWLMNLLSTDFANECMQADAVTPSACMHWQPFAHSVHIHLSSAL